MHQYPAKQPQCQDLDAACEFARFSTSGIPCSFPAKMLGSEWGFPQPGPGRRVLHSMAGSYTRDRARGQAGNMAWYGAEKLLANEGSCCRGGHRCGVLTLIMIFIAGQCLRNFDNLAGGRQHASHCDVGVCTRGGVEYFALWEGAAFPSPTRPNGCMHAGELDSLVRPPHLDDLVADASRRLRASSTLSGAFSRCQVS